MDPFKGLIVRQEDDQVTYQIEDLTLDDLTQGPITIKVDYSTVNYKDMLATQAKGGVVRDYPMIPGIDLVGQVVESQDEHFKPGENVMVISTDLGVSKTGGFAQYVRTDADHLTRLPEGLSPKDAMTFGTAGFTAALSIQALVDHGLSLEEDPNILITGATGGVGSVALKILSHLGYTKLHALVRKDYQVEVAQKLGANFIVQAQDLAAGRSTLDSRNFQYVLDTVGGDVASKALAQIDHNGAMSMCGNAGGAKMEASVLPFILRGVNVLGINSVSYPLNAKAKIWQKLAQEWNVADQLVTSEVPLKDLDQTITALKEGKHLGRTVVKLNDQ